MQQVKSTLVNLVATAQTMIAAVAVIAVIVALIGVINTILMSVYERTAEIGIMKALGARRSGIFQLIWLETLMICLAGAVVGSVAGCRRRGPGGEGHQIAVPTWECRVRLCGSPRRLSAMPCWAR